MVRRWLTALCACLAGWASAQGASLPSFVNWSNDGAWQRENAFRAEIVLNGWWRWQLVEGDAPSPPTEGWRYRKAPGVGTRFRILDADGQSTILKGKDREAQLKIVTGECWAEREFTIPAAWKDRDVQLILENVTGDGEVWLNGQRVGHTWPLRPHHLDIPKPYRVEQPYRLSIRSNGILSNVWLKAHAPDAVRIEDSYLMTSVRAMTGMIRASGRGDVAAARVTITEHDAPGNVVKVAGPFPVDAADGKWQLEKSFDWKDAKLWSLESPNLYDYFLEALDKEGRVRDCIFPIRFGFREVWVKDGDFMLNHRRITLTMDIHTPLATQAGYGKDWGRAGHTANVEVWRRAFRRWKKLGVNTAVHRWSANVDDSALFQAADEEGFFISMDVFGLQYGNPDFQKIPSILAHTQDLNRYLILPRRHCPSVPFYYLPGTSNTWDFEPSKLGEDYDTEEVFGRHNRPERELVRQLDPSRVAFAHSGGGKGEPVHSSMNYIHIDADLQAHETWPSHWHQTRRKPLATYEMAAPPYIADWYQRRSRGEQAHGTPGVLPYFLEVGAIYLGEEPYLTESRATVEAWLDRAAKKQSQMFPKWTVKSYEKSALLFTRNVYRAWRTYGVNMGFFTEVRGYYSGPPFVLEPSSADPRRPGLAPDEPISLADPFLDEPYTEVGLAAKEALSPLLMYLGGPDGEFTRKDRAFFSGEKVRKAVVVLNDRDRPAAVSGAWQLCDASGKAVLQGTLPETRLQPGELAPARIHVEFETPAVDSRADFTLRLNGKADAEGALNDEVRLAVFPRPAKPALGKGVEVFLYDPVGETRAVLERAGVKHTLLAGTLPDPTTSLLVVGRNALKAEAHRAAFAKLLYARMGHDFGVNTTNGMRVLVFEQALDNVWGLKTEQTRWRRAWPLAPGHPALAGLGPDDLIYLRGDSNLAEPYPPAPPGKAGRVATDRFSEWGNDNVVSTYTFLRPQLGAMRALVACGFDQQETPLLEAAAGKGRLMFCQFDVTNRYGLDPVSTRLVHNLLTYMTAAPPPDPSVGQPVDLVREGWEDYPLDIKTEKRFFMADKPPGPISWGISAADLYFEGFLDLPVIQAADGKKSLYAALPGKNRFAHVLNRRHFPTKWQKMKAQMVRAALEINQGGSSEVFPNPSLQGDNEELYPLEWLEGFVHPYLMMQW